MGLCETIKIPLKRVDNQPHFPYYIVYSNGYSFLPNLSFTNNNKPVYITLNL